MTNLQRNTVPRMSTTNNASPPQQHRGISVITAEALADTALLATPQRIPGRPVLPEHTLKTQLFALMAEAPRRHKEGMVQTPVPPREAPETQATSLVTQPLLIIMARVDEARDPKEIAQHPGGRSPLQQGPNRSSSSSSSSSSSPLRAMLGSSTKMEASPAAAAVTGIKPTTGAPTAPPPTKIATPPLVGIGSKAAPVGIGSKPVGIGSAAAGQPPAEGENVLTKILQGGAAEQAGKLGDGFSGGNVEINPIQCCSEQQASLFSPEDITVINEDVEKRRRKEEGIFESCSSSFLRKLPGICVTRSCGLSQLCPISAEQI
ncbi:Protein bassoon [Liparis tanakae]|uniref:Protein bassoon n=1 Tax=Liparis tanakae TaxID=230148 RepID=A0A4Z2J3R5_9TELE|nr:Protein bassoon [Liparis tanakae]